MILPGTIITFRYKTLNRNGFNSPKHVLVLNPNYNGDMHALKIDLLSPAQQEVLQNVFIKMYTNAQMNVLFPMENHIANLRQQLEQINKQQNQEIGKAQKTVLSPLTPMKMSNVIQSIKSVKSVASSVFNKIKTFGRTPIQSQPAANQKQINEIIEKNNILLQKKNEELNKALMIYENQKKSFDSIPIVPKDPYMFYHQFLKPYVGNNSVMKEIYRKYKLQFIITPRIERLPR